MVKPTKAEVQTERLAAIKARHANDVDQAWAFDDIAWLVSRADEIERLRAELRAIQQWDCLNPPDPKLCADHPWLRRVVDDALGGPKDG